MKVFEPSGCGDLLGDLEKDDTTIGTFVGHDKTSRVLSSKH